MWSILTVLVQVLRGHKVRFLQIMAMSSNVLSILLQDILVRGQQSTLFFAMLMAQSLTRLRPSQLMMMIRADTPLL